MTTIVQMRSNLTISKFSCNKQVLKFEEDLFNIKWDMIYPCFRPAPTRVQTDEHVFLSGKYKKEAMYVI